MVEEPRSRDKSGSYMGYKCRTLSLRQARQNSHVTSSDRGTHSTISIPQNTFAF
jgi:hypothetical protein